MCIELHNMFVSPAWELSVSVLWGPEVSALLACVIEQEVARVLIEVSIVVDEVLTQYISCLPTLCQRSGRVLCNLL